MLDFESKETALNAAVWHGQIEIAKFLLKEGASPDLRGRFGDRPIDSAIELDRDDFLKLLAKPNQKETMVGGVPEGLLREILVGQEKPPVLFLSWNDQDPPDELMNWLKNQFPNIRPVSRMETLSRRPQGAHTWYRDKKEGSFGKLIQIKPQKDGDVWIVWFRKTSGPVLAGGGWQGKFRKEHGYWHKFEMSGWSE